MLIPCNGKADAVTPHQIARHPQAEGPVTLSRFTCPVSHFDVIAPRFDAKTSFNESFTSVDGSGRMAISTLTAGANGLAAFTGDLTYKAVAAFYPSCGHATDQLALPTLIMVGDADDWTPAKDCTRLMARRAGRYRPRQSSSR